MSYHDGPGAPVVRTSRRCRGVRSADAGMLEEFLAAIREGPGASPAAGTATARPRSRSRRTSRSRPASRSGSRSTRPSASAKQRDGPGRSRAPVAAAGPVRLAGCGTRLTEGPLRHRLRFPAGARRAGRRRARARQGAGRRGRPRPVGTRDRRRRGSAASPGRPGAAARISLCRAAPPRQRRPRRRGGAPHAVAGGRARPAAPRTSAHLLLSSTGSRRPPTWDDPAHGDRRRTRRCRRTAPRCRRHRPPGGQGVRRRGVPGAVLRCDTAEEAAERLVDAGYAVVGMAGGADETIFGLPSRRMSPSCSAARPRASRWRSGVRRRVGSIPMPGNVESLNVASAAAVVAFELVRRGLGRSDGGGVRRGQSSG